jgi:hypothetical protein
MKPIAHKRFYILLDNKLYWSKAYQSLTLSARNLLWCMVAELTFSGSRMKKTFAYTNNGKISFTETEFKKQGLGASGTYLRARDKLIKVGLIRITYRGGYARGDMNTYELLINSELAPQSKQRWKRYPKENWEHEIPKIKEYAVGKKTRFKKSKNTLKNDTLNGTNPPKELDPSLETSLKDKGVNNVFRPIKTPVG